MVVRSYPFHKLAVIHELVIHDEKLYVTWVLQLWVLYAFLNLLFPISILVFCWLEVLEVRVPLLLKFDDIIFSLEQGVNMLLYLLLSAFVSTMCQGVHLVQIVLDLHIDGIKLVQGDHWKGLHLEKTGTYLLLGSTQSPHREVINFFKHRRNVCRLFGCQVYYLHLRRVGLFLLNNLLW